MRLVRGRVDALDAETARPVCQLNVLRACVADARSAGLHSDVYAEAHERQMRIEDGVKALTKAAHREPGGPMNVAALQEAVAVAEEIGVSPDLIGAARDLVEQVTDATRTLQAQLSSAPPVYVSGLRAAVIKARDVGVATELIRQGDETLAQVARASESLKVALNRPGDEETLNAAIEEGERLGVAEDELDGARAVQERVTRAAMALSEAMRDPTGLVPVQRAQWLLEVITDAKRAEVRATRRHSPLVTHANANAKRDCASHTDALRSPRSAGAC